MQLYVLSYFIVLVPLSRHTCMLLSSIVINELPITLDNSSLKSPGQSTSTELVGVLMLLPT